MNPRLCSRIGGPLLVLPALLVLLAPKPASAQLTLAGAGFTIGTCAAGEALCSRASDIKFDPVNNVYLIVWGAFKTARGRFIDADGNPLGPGPFQIPQAMSWSDFPRLAYSRDAGGFLVVWQDTRYDPNQSQVWGRMVAYGGNGLPTFTTNDFLVTSSIVHPAPAPAVVYSKTSTEFLVAFHTFANNDIVGQRVSNSGTLVGASFPITATSNWETRPSLAYNSNADEYLVTYEVSNDTVQWIEGKRIKAGTGAILGAPLVIEDPTPELLSFSEAEFDAVTNRYLVIWYRSPNASSRAVYGRFVNGDGSYPAARFTVAAGYGSYDDLGLAQNPTDAAYVAVFYAPVGYANSGVRISAAGGLDPIIDIIPDTGAPNFYPRVGANARRPEWLVATSPLFTSTIGQRVAGPGAGLPPSPTFGDFTGDGRADIVTYQPETGIWYVNGVAKTTFGLPNDIPVPGDYNKDGKTDPAIFRPATGIWYVEGQPPVQFGLPGDIPVPADYTGDGQTDKAIFRPATAQWYVQGQNAVVWGATGDVPVPADYDGDQKADLAVFRPADGRWYIRFSSTGQNRQAVWGVTGDVPVPGDYQGDGLVDLAVYRPATSTWHIEGVGTHQFGAVGDWPLALDMDGDGRAEIAAYRPWTGVWSHQNITTGKGTSQQVAGTGHLLPLRRPVPGGRRADSDGDGVADPTVFRPASGSWITLSTSSGLNTSSLVGWGLAGDIPIAIDFDGDGKADRAVYRPSAGLWAIARSASGTAAVVNWGLSSDLPVAADYDGDGRADLALFRPSDGIWYVLLSSNGYMTTLPWMEWGASGDVPLAADVDGDRRADLIIYKPTTGTWSILLSAENYSWARRFTWGKYGDVPIAADYDGDGRADLALFRPSTGSWFVLRSSSNYTTYMYLGWGATGDTPMGADADGDGRADVGVYRPSTGTWHILLSSSGNARTLTVPWGAAGDVPVWK